MRNLIATQILYILVVNCPIWHAKVVENGHWGFIKGDVVNYVTNELVAASSTLTKGRFTFDYFNNDDQVLISLKDSTLFATISPTGLLQTTTNSSEATVFLMNRAGPDFTIGPPDNPLVTRNPREPFSFHTMSAYPDESAVIFFLEPADFDVDAIYQGQRGNISATLRAIKAAGAGINQTAAYETLVQLMTEKYNHLPGKEIFSVGFEIGAVLGQESSTFVKLPEIVRFILAEGEPGYLITDVGTQSYKMRNNVSLTLTYKAALYPFKFRRLDVSEVLWEVSFNTEFRNRLYIGELGGPRLLYSSDETQYLRPFEIHLSNDTTKFHVYDTGSRGFIRRHPTTTFAFSTSTDATLAAHFSLAPYVITVTDMYNYLEVGDLAQIIYLYGGEIGEVERLFRLVISAVAPNYSGTGILHLGIYMQRKGFCGENADIFDGMRPAIKIISCGLPATFIHKHGGVNYTMKYSFSSDLHENVAPYRFEHDLTLSYSGRPSKAGMAVVYGDNYQLVLDGDRLVDERFEGELKYLFDFYFSGGEQPYSYNRFHIRFNGRSFGTTTSEPDFYFQLGQSQSTFELVSYP